MARPRKAPGELGRITTDQRGERWRGRAKVVNGNGEQVLITEYADSRVEVERLVRERAQAIWSGLFVEVTKTTTVDQLAQLWLASPRVKKLQATTQQTYAANIRTIISPRIGAVRVEALTPAFLSHFIDQLQIDVSPAYASTARKMLSLILNVAVKQGIFPSNPVATVERISHEERDYLSLNAEQVPLVLMLMSQWRGKNPDRRGGVRPNYRLLVDTALVMLGSSARPGEVLGVRRSDVKFTPEGRMQMRIGGTVVQTKEHGNHRKNSPKKARQRRWITLPAYSADVLKRRMAEYVDNPDGLLFATKNGTPYSVNKLELMYRDFRDHTKDELRALEVEPLELFTPKVFRKTAATALEKGGGDPDIMRRALGHANIRTTRDHYLPPEDVVPEVTADILDVSFPGLASVDDLRG